MTKYENSVFPYLLHSTVNLPALWSKDTNVTLISFPRLFAEAITPKRKKFFFQNFRINVVKIDEIREELSTSYFVT